MATATVKAAVSERIPVAAPVGVNDMICDQRMVADNIDVIDLADAQKELSTVSPQKPAGTVHVQRHDNYAEVFISFQHFTVLWKGI